MALCRVLLVLWEERRIFGGIHTHFHTKRIAEATAVGRRGKGVQGEVNGGGRRRGKGRLCAWCAVDMGSNVGAWEG